MHSLRLRADWGKVLVRKWNPARLFSILLLLSLTAEAGRFEQGMASLEKGDFAEAYCIWRPMAARGHQDAAYHLGWLYANGNGLRIDLSKAVYWWTQAANQGHTDAQFALGLAFTTGEGIGTDKQEALRWYIKAAEAGHEDAREIIREQVRTGDTEVREELAHLISRPWLGKNIRLSVDSANLRAGPGTDSRVVGKIAKDTLLVAIDQRGKWYQVIEPEALTYSWIAGWLTEDVQ